MLKYNEQGLIPVVTQDCQTRQVLMVAYMNQEAYEMTLETGRMHYYSRSRQALWMKGETSGHIQELKRLSLDCDGDTLLAEVNQVGPACHTGHETCFFNLISGDRPKRIIDSLIETIDDRYVNPVQGSYTNYLFDQGLEKILKKVGEEATEVVIAAMAGKGDEMVYELSDLLYHCLVLMKNEGISLSEIYQELEKRHG